MSFTHIRKQRAKRSAAPRMLEHFSVYDVIKYPISSEKSLTQSSLLNAYHFAVDRRATKNDVKKAIKTIYSVSPLSVTTSILPHKGRMNRKTVRKSFKKAIVTLKK